MKKNYLFVLISLIGLVLAACSGNNNNNNSEPNDSGNGIVENNQDERESEDDQNDVSNPSVEVKMTPIEAYDRYLEEFSNAKVGKVQLDKDRGSYVYEIEGFDDQSEYKLEINSSNGEIIESKSEKDNDTHTEIPKELLNDVQALVDEAHKEAGGAAFLEGWEVEFDNGKFILEVTLEKENGEDMDYKYNLETKELLTIES